MTPCKFSFDDTPDFDGFTDGTEWNGWANVWCTPETHAAVVTLFAALYGEDDETVAEFRAMTPNDKGLVSYAYGYTVWITDENEMTFGKITSDENIRALSEQAGRYDMRLRDALVMAYGALNNQPDKGTLESAALREIADLLAQRGCEDDSDAQDSAPHHNGYLTTLCETYIRG